MTNQTKIDGLDTVPLKGSHFEEYFEPEQVSSSRIRVASPTQARSLWADVVDARARTFFQLDDAHWLTQEPDAIIGRTTRKRDSPHFSRSSQAMREAVSWQQDSEVAFFATNLQVLLCTWRGFLETWPSFLVAYDDCPFVMNLEPRPTAAFVFTARGEIRLLTRIGEQEEE